MNFIRKFMVVFSLLMIFAAHTAYAATVVIDPGHGGVGTEGSGAIYPPYMEKALTLDVATKLRDELAASGVSVEMTRTSDRALSLPQRANIAKSSGAKLLVSIHFNASGPHDKTGSEVWTSMYGNHYKVGAECGSQILSQLTALGLESKGVKTKMGSQGDYYGVVRYGTALGVPTVIVEHCFLDNPYDRSILESRGTAAFAHADAVGIMNFLGGGTGQALVSGALDISPVNTASTAIAAGAGGGGASSLASNFTPAEWQWLLSQWAYTGNAEAVMSQVPLSDLKALVAEHNRGNI